MIEFLLGMTSGRVRDDLAAAIRKLDAAQGVGFASDHPELVAVTAILTTLDRYAPSVDTHDGWEDSEAATITRGRELGLEARPGESLQDFRARIHAAKAINRALSGAKIALQTSAAHCLTNGLSGSLGIPRSDAVPLDHKWKVGLPNLVESLGATMMQSRIPFLCLLGCYLNAAPYKVCADLVEHLVKIGYGEDLEGTLGEIVDHGI